MGLKLKLFMIYCCIFFKQKKRGGGVNQRKLIQWFEIIQGKFLMIWFWEFLMKYIKNFLMNV